MSNKPLTVKLSHPVDHDGKRYESLVFNGIDFDRLVEIDGRNESELVAIRSYAAAMADVPDEVIGKLRLEDAKKCMPEVVKYVGEFREAFLAPA